MAMRVKYELTICSPCAYLFSYGEYNDGTDFAEAASAYAEAKYGGDLFHFVLGEEVDGWSRFTCDTHGEEYEGTGQHTASILEAVSD